MLIGSDKIYIGYDLSYGYAQISYCRQLDDTPETYSLTEGTEQYNIPVSLFKRKGINQWFVGKEALVFSEHEEGVLIDNIYQKTLDMDTVLIEDEEFETIALLALYVKWKNTALVKEILQAKAKNRRRLARRFQSGQKKLLKKRILQGLFLSLFWEKNLMRK